MSDPRLRWAVISAMALVAAGCEAVLEAEPFPLPDTFPAPAPSPEPGPGPGPDTGGTPLPPTPVFRTSGNPDIDRWRLGFFEKAMAEGRDPAVAEALLANLRPLDLYLGADAQVASTDIGGQAEFAKPIWEYLDSAVSSRRRSNGMAVLSEYDSLFDALEREYRVDRQVLVAIWGMETSYGGYIGDFDAANTLANMAVEGRRQGFAERELLALMKIVEAGHADRNELTSGWAGAMGQTQFMPSTFLAYAEDFEGDGRKDVWGNPADALASAANYLAVSGYRYGQPWGIEVRLPPSFDFSFADGQDRRVYTWLSLGVRPMDGDTFETNGAEFAELWVPAGASGPKYLLFKNFDVFKTYNRADSYAMAVGVLSDSVLGAGGPQTPWPRDVELLSVAQIKLLQARLNDLGYGAGAVDGIAGRGTKGALRGYQKDRGLVADGFPTRAMLDHVLATAQSGSVSLAAPG
ncbi:MAG: lytic murein transglycosylase [Pseudomonadota bacterium]